MRYWKEAFQEETAGTIALEVSWLSSYLCLDLEHGFLQGAEVWDTKICVHGLLYHL